MQTRRLVAVGVIVVVVIAMALLIKNCQGSATESALKQYDASVYQLIARSNSTFKDMFSKLTGGNLGSADFATDVTAAHTQMHDTENLRAPSQMASAQSGLLTVMKLRYQAIRAIANAAPGAAQKSSSAAAVTSIATSTSMLYASDVLYKTQVGPDIAKALNAANIPVGSGTGGAQPINNGQVVPDLGWLQSTWIATKIGAHLSTKAANANNTAPGLHGHSLNYVTVDGVQLSPTGTNTVPANNAQTWTLNVSNGGHFNEYSVGCSVQIQGASDTGSSTIAQTTPGETTNCTVQLASKPPAGVYTVVAKVARVPREANVKNNTITYTVTFN